MKCSQCLGPLKADRTRLNGTPVYVSAVSEERLKALETLYEAVEGVLFDANAWTGEPGVLVDGTAYAAMYEAAERVKYADAPN